MGEYDLRKSYSTLTAIETAILHMVVKVVVCMCSVRLLRGGVVVVVVCGGLVS
jgi:hypothetical protein